MRNEGEREEGGIQARKVLGKVVFASPLSLVLWEEGRKEGRKEKGEESGNDK